MNHRVPFFNRDASGPFAATAYNASIPQYVVLPNYKDPGTGNFVDLQFVVDPPQPCYVRLNATIN